MCRKIDPLTNLNSQTGLRINNEKSNIIIFNKKDRTFLMSMKLSSFTQNS